METRADEAARMVTELKWNDIEKLATCKGFIYFTEFVYILSWMCTRPLYSYPR